MTEGPVEICCERIFSAYTLSHEVKWTVESLLEKGRSLCFLR